MRIECTDLTNLVLLLPPLPFHNFALHYSSQVRSIAEVTKAVAGGDLTKKIQVDVTGEILDLKETVNEMTESLSVLADEVTRVA